MEMAGTQSCLSDRELYEKYSRVLPSGGGACVELIGKDEVPKTMVIAYFGKKSSKSGWKYDCKQTPEEASSIYDLWQRVYNERHMPNREISLQFAGGLILQCQDQPVNWVEFAVGREKFRMRSKKVVGNQKSVGGEDVNQSSAAARVFVLGKRRFSASSPPPVFKLTQKEEVLGELESVKKAMGCPVSKSKAVGLGLFSPTWAASEVDELVSGIPHCQKLVYEFEDEVLERSAKKKSFEVEARRARMLLSDRMMLLNEAKVAVQRLCEEEAMLESAISDKNESERGSICGLSSVLDVGRRAELVVSKMCHERTVSLSSSVVSECQSSISIIEASLEESSKRHSVVVGRVSSLKDMLDRFGVLLQRMQNGSGNVFYPRPIFSNPESPISTVHMLNACPLCGYWYSCHNFITLGCGHTYHHWCLSEHSQKSSSCLIQSCLEPFLLESAIAIGICLQAGVTYTCTEQLSLSEGLLVKENGGSQHTSLQVHARETSSCTIQRSSRIQIPSQSRQITILNIGSPATMVEKEEVAGICIVCKTRGAAVLVKDCGHNEFCFNCIQGLRECPICKEPISGWNTMKSKATISPLLLSLGDAFDKSLDPLLPKHAGKKKSNPSTVEVVRHAISPVEVVVHTDVSDKHAGGGGESSDEDDVVGFNIGDDDEVEGLISSSAEDAFQNGATCFINIGLTGELHVVENEGTPGACELGPAQAPANEMELQQTSTDQDIHVPLERASGLKRPCFSRHTRALDELMAERSNVASEEVTQFVEPAPKKKVGRRVMVSKVVSHTVMLRSPRLAAVVQKGRGGNPRSSSTHNLVPCKFRGL